MFLPSACPIECNTRIAITSGAVHFALQILADLDAWPAIDTMPARDPKDPQHEALPDLPRALRQHHARAQKQGWRGSAKLSAVAGEIRRLKDADVTTQFVVVSQYGDLLDELQEAFDPVGCSA